MPLIPTPQTEGLPRRSHKKHSPSQALLVVRRQVGSYRALGIIGLVLGSRLVGIDRDRSRFDEQP
jgi:hypothetical protein